MATHVKVREDGKIQLSDVRCAFVNIFETAKFEGEDTNKYAITFLLPNDDPEDLKIIEKHAEALLKDAGIKVKIGPDKRYYRDGADQPYDGFEGHWSLKGSSETRPTIVDRQRNRVEKKDGIIYGGCYVNGILDPWIQDNRYGKRVNATLTGVQFVRNGDPFVGGRPAAVEEFDELEPSDMEDVF